MTADYTARAQAARDAAVEARMHAEDASQRAYALPHSDPEYDAAWRCHGLYMQLMDVMLDLGETFELYARSEREYRDAKAVTA
jgi:hypothetical protein